MQIWTQRETRESPMDAIDVVENLALLFLNDAHQRKRIYDASITVGLAQKEKGAYTAVVTTMYRPLQPGMTEASGCDGDVKKQVFAITEDLTVDEAHEKLSFEAQKWLCAHDPSWYTVSLVLSQDIFKRFGLFKSNAILKCIGRLTIFYVDEGDVDIGELLEDDVVRPLSIPPPLPIGR